MDLGCTICGKPFNLYYNTTIYALECGHVFHGPCLNEHGDACCPDCGQSSTYSKNIQLDLATVSNDSAFKLRKRNGQLNGVLNDRDATIRDMDKILGKQKAEIMNLQKQQTMDADIIQSLNEKPKNFDNMIVAGALEIKDLKLAMRKKDEEYHALEQQKAVESPQHIQTIRSLVNESTAANNRLSAYVNSLKRGGGSYDDKDDVVKLYKLGCQQELLERLQSYTISPVEKISVSLSHANFQEHIPFQRIITKMTIECELCGRTGQEKYGGGMISTGCKHDFHLNCIYDHCLDDTNCPCCYSQICLASLERIKRENIVRDKNQKIRNLELKLCQQKKDIGSLEQQLATANARVSQLESSAQANASGRKMAVKVRALADRLVRMSAV